MTKKCSKCREIKPFEEFAKNKSKKDGLTDTCKPCKAAQVRDYYAATPIYRQSSKDRVEAAKRRNKIKVYQYLLQHPCIDCGEDDVMVLDLDHRDARLKIENVSSLTRKAVKWETVQKEIDKCDVRCSNCHRRRTAKQFNGYSLLEEAKRELLIDSDASVS